MTMQLLHEPAIHPSNLDGCMRTLSGKKFDLLNPSPDMININDIASGLANSGHFSGQSPYMFSIAQHCVMVCDEYALQNPDAPDKMKLLALMHDASEGYTGDLIKPLKVLLPGFVEIENRIMAAISIRYNLPASRLPEIKPYDLYIQNVEYNAFYRSGPITYMDPETARKVFLDRFNEYYHGQ